MSSIELVAIIIYNLSAIVLTCPSQGFALHWIKCCKNMQEKKPKQTPVLKHLKYKSKTVSNSQIQDYKKIAIYETSKITDMSKN